MAQRERQRHIPSPLNFTPRSPPPLLYDLPSTSFTQSSTTATPSVTSPRSPRSPPRTPRARGQALLSPKSANLNSLHGSRGSVTNLHHPQPSPYSSQAAHGTNTPNRSVASTPTQLDAFGALCRSWYFQQDAQAGTQIQEILRSIPASQRASYTRLQAQIRSSYHTAVALRRESEFHAHLTSTKPGQSLTPMNRQNPTSASAKAERLERMQKLVSVWATSGNVGTRPFFEGLFAVLRLQGLPENLGGAGGRRVCWEMDDAVFKESAGKEFMLEAIDVLKGVLGFEEAQVGFRDHGRETLSPAMVVEPPSRSRSPPPSAFTKPPPPPLPQRPEARSQGLGLEPRSGRPPLPSIASASIINRRHDSSAQRNEDIEAVLVDDDEDDTFADPVPAHRRCGSVPLSQGNARRSIQDTLNRNRSPSDPFADTHGHLNYGHGRGRSRTQGSLGTMPPPAPSPSLTPLLVNGDGSSSFGKTSLSTGSELQKTVPLPSEDFELDVAGSSRTGGTLSTTAPAPVTPDSDEEDELLGQQEAPSKRSRTYGLGLAGKNRRGSETTGLGLVGPGLDQPPKAAPSATVTQSHVSQPKTRTPNGSFSLSKPALFGQSNSMVMVSHFPPSDDEPQLRIWTSPSYLGNPEIAQLLSVFPTNISNGSVPRFKGTAGAKNPKSRQSGSIRSRRGRVDLDLEAQEYEEQPIDDREWVRHGTGRLCVSQLQRDEGWKGSMWERLRSWWRRVFC